MSALKSPRFWTLVWGAIGAALVLYVMIAASVKPAGERVRAPKLRDPALLVGDMADFIYAPTRTAPPDIAFQRASESGLVDARLADFRGRVTLVNFWASWCAPCVKELPSLDRLQAALGDEAFEVVAIAVEARGADYSREFLEKIGARGLRLNIDPNLRLASALGAGAGLPLTILYGRDGREIGRLRGDADWSSAEAKRLIEAAKTAG